MPLSKSVTREAVHHRAINCRGYRRSDGLWDIEGHLVDTKSYPFSTKGRGELSPGEPLHEMWLRLTVDSNFIVFEVEATTDKAPYSGCENFPNRFHLLKGMKISSGWTRKIRKELGGVNGCTHLVELLGPMATTAFQTIYPLTAMSQNKKESNARPPLIDTCHTFSSDGVVVQQQWPAFYTGNDTD